MEIKLENVSCHNHQYQLEKLSLQLSQDAIIGVYGKEKTLFLEMIYGEVTTKGSVFFQGKKRTKLNNYEMNQDIVLIPKNWIFDSLFPTVEEQFRYYLYSKRISMKHLDKRIKDSLKIVGLDESYLSRNLTCLSTSEIKQIQIACYMLSNPKVILLDEPLAVFDYQTKKYFLKLFQMLKEKYHKTVIIASDDTDFLYQNTDICVLLKNSKCLKTDKSNELFTDVPFLLEHKIPVPRLTYFTYLVYKNKKRKLSYHKDIRDLMKDIYKHIDF